MKMNHKMKNNELLDRLCSFLHPFLIVLPTVTLIQSCNSALKAEDRTEDRPLNVLFIVVDDLRPELGCYENKQIKSPNIDRLAGEAVLFTRAYCQQSLCAPSRASMLSGLRPDSTHIYRLITRLREAQPGIITLPQHFRQNGYHTVSLGKIFHHREESPGSWSEKEWLPELSYMDYKSQANIEIQRRTGSEVAMATDRAEEPDSTYIDGMILDRAIQQLTALKDSTFFLFVGFIRPHLPFIAPEKYWKMYSPDDISLPFSQHDPLGAPEYALTRRWEIDRYVDIPSYSEKKELPREKVLELRHGYYASVSFIDVLIGKLINTLKELDLYDHTIIVLWGDHGFKIGEHGEWAKFTNFEIDTRIPLIVRVPGTGSTGMKTDAIVEAVDIYPTLCDLARLPVPSHLQGESFAPVLDDPGIPWDQVAFSQFWRDNGAFRDHPIMGLSMRTDSFRFTRWHYMEWPDSVVGYELYDMSASYYCLENIAMWKEYKECVDAMDRKLKAGWKASLQ